MNIYLRHYNSETEEVSYYKCIVGQASSEEGTFEVEAGFFGNILEAAKFMKSKGFMKNLSVEEWRKIHYSLSSEESAFYNHATDLLHRYHLKIMGEYIPLRDIFEKLHDAFL